MDRTTTQAPAAEPKILPPPIDTSKPVRCKAGYPVRILTVDHSLPKPIIGVIEADHLLREVSQWTLGGQYLTTSSSSGVLDLENVEPHALEFEAWFASVENQIERDPLTSTLTIARTAWDAARGAK